ncbi:MAG: outer membrane protein assembly factor BamE [Betaproteobacteria bacterium]|jgi:outer membrane protein assembly factor BamE|nr:outer membrane protein assembly factor BamE [Betaproteobacteria bacterium]
MYRQLALACGFVACAVMLSACGPLVYRIEIQQGNLVTQENVAQLKPGMSKDQVRFVLGTPLVTDIFHADRWDYVYTLQPARTSSIKEERRLTLFFDKDGRLERVEGDVVPKGSKPGPTADSK